MCSAAARVNGCRRVLAGAVTFRSGKPRGCRWLVLAGAHSANAAQVWTAATAMQQRPHARMGCASASGTGRQRARAGAGVGVGVGAGRCVVCCPCEVSGQGRLAVEDGRRWRAGGRRAGAAMDVGGVLLARCTAAMRSLAQ